jgi:tetratricopeptide (TPR) repeat protein
MTMTEQHQQSALLGKIAAYTELLLNDPRSTIFVSLAETYRKMGLFNDAREIVTKGLDVHPDFGPAYVVLARIECQLENIEASCIAFERALALDPDSLAALVGYARVKLLLHHDASARELLLHARSLSPADPVINKMLLGLTVQPETEDEVASVPPVVESGSAKAINLTALASTTLADLYLAQGLTEKALGLYHQLLSRNPDNLELRRKIREIEGRTEDLSPSSTEEDEPSLLTTSEDLTEAEGESVTESLAEESVLETDAVFTEPELIGEENLEATDMFSLSADQTMSDVQADKEYVQNLLSDSVLEETSVSDDPSEIIDKLNIWLNNIRLRREHV